MDELFVARHIDEAQHRTVGRRQIRKAQLDRDAAGLLFFEAVGVDAGQRPHQRGLAVIDVTRGADDHTAISGKGAEARASASANSTGDSVPRTASKNGCANVLPPLRARSSSAKAAIASRGTPAPR